MKKIYAFVKGLVVGLVIFCALGLVAHAYVGIFASPSQTDECAEYSLKNRFETAFSFNTPESHKFYWDDYPDGDSSGAPVGKTPYLAHPAVTYAFLVLCGIVGVARKEN